MSTDWRSRFHALLHEIEAIEDDIGTYPNAMQGYNDEGDCAQREGIKKGWNAAIEEYGNKIAEAAERAAEGVDEDIAMLLAANAGSLCDGKFSINMNDTWAWTLAWHVDVPSESLSEVAGLFRRWGFAGILYWVAKTKGQNGELLRSEFKDINRFVDFVHFEETLRSAVPNSSQRAFMDFDNPASPKPSMWQRLKALLGNDRSELREESPRRASEGPND